MKRYKIRKEQLERVVESFVMENTKKGLNESELLKEGFGDLVSGIKVNNQEFLTETLITHKSTDIKKKITTKIKIS